MSQPNPVPAISSSRGCHSAAISHSGSVRRRSCESSGTVRISLTFALDLNGLFLSVQSCAVIYFQPPCIPQVLGSALLGLSTTWSSHVPTHTCTQQTCVSLPLRSPLHLQGGCPRQNRHIYPGNPALPHHRIETERPDLVEDVPAPLQGGWTR